MTAGDVIGEATDLDALVEILRQRKAALQLSDQLVDELAGLSAGHTGKVLGAAPTKFLGRISLGALLGALALRLVVVEDREALARVGKRWERREDSRVHDNGRISRLAIRRVRPIIMSELARKGAAARWKNATADDRRAAAELMNLGREMKRTSRAGMMEPA
jgi:hypothetical protein